MKIGHDHGSKSVMTVYVLHIKTIILLVTLFSLHINKLRDVAENTMPIKTLILLTLFLFSIQLFNTLFLKIRSSSPIKCAAVSGSAAVTGGSDDTIKIYDLSTSSEIGSLHYSSTVSSLCFFTPTSSSSFSFPRNLIAAADDGAVIIYDADPFIHLKTIKGVHKKGVNDLSVHPSGKLALTVGRDECLAMVNLVRGRRSFCCRLGKEASIVRFSESGEKFFMAVDEKVTVHVSEDARLIFELDNRKRVLCAASGADGILFTGGEDRNIIAWDTTSGKVAYSIEDAHSTRIKGMVVLSKSDGATTGDDPYLVASASSDGVIRVWDVRMVNKEKSNPLTEAKTKSRLTCLAGSSFKSVRRPQVGDANHCDNPVVEEEES